VACFIIGKYPEDIGKHRQVLASNEDGVDKRRVASKRVRMRGDEIPGGDWAHGGNVMREGDKSMMTMGDDAMDGSDNEHLRPARMRIKTTVLMSHGDESHPTDLIDISATGVLLRRPRAWSGQAGESWVLDMIFGHDLHIHLEAKVARLSEKHIGFAYTRIPEDKQVPLWNLLGGYADILEMWHDE
jgi:hypothetical protein